MTLPRLIALLLLLPLTGCAYIASFSDNLEQQVDEWAAQQEYGKALAALDYARPNRADYSRLMAKRDGIAAKARSYEQATVTQAGQLARQGKWGEALDLYDQALARLPDSKALQEGRTHLTQLQTTRVNELQLELLMARAEGLLQTLPAYSAIAEANPRDPQAQQHSADRRREAEAIAGELTRRGRAALARKDLALAQRTLPLALRLWPTSDNKQANQELLQLRAQPPEVKVVKKSREVEIRELLARYRQAYDAREWVEARRLLALLALEEPPPPELPPLQQELGQAIAATVKRYVEQGVAFYSNGRYEEAIGVWQKALVLAPEDERIRTHITRAERVLEKLRTLKEKQVTD